ncbi:transposase and inactivated derivatives [Serpentinimonas maccroryi]|uniref:Transposase and inactivated derivatives n=1 Tax=Serpentinimonas maccroryi TaxID=1458426 RepID=A0A060NQ30_9BURK|nr:transposase and inactivated derivatives [Serpentinimonas maccroryi]
MTTRTQRDEEEVKAGLFEDMPQPPAEQTRHAQAKAALKPEGAPRLLQPNRSQIELRASDLESLLPPDHRARLVWGYVQRQNLSQLLQEIKARGSNAGRAAIDPHILFALWLYATLDGVGSGREVARLSQEHDAYR